MELGPLETLKMIVQHLEYRPKPREMKLYLRHDQMMTRIIGNLPGMEMACEYMFYYISIFIFLRLL